MSEESRAHARRRLAACFSAAGIDSADLDARLLVCDVAGIDHAGLVRDPEVPVGRVAAERLAGLAARRLNGEPISRILGRKEFWGLPLQVTPAVLDPRPETEGLVGSVLDAVGGRQIAPLAILDLGTGSGAILLALLHELSHATGVGIDRSMAACRVAHDNAEATGLAQRTRIVCGDWADAVQARFDIVVSNPPYIATADIECLGREVRAHDPLDSLDGGDDGFAAYRRIVSSLHRLLRPGGIAAFECGSGQGARIAGMMDDAGIGAAVYLDLAGHDRVVIGAAAG